MDQILVLKGFTIVSLTMYGKKHLWATVHHVMLQFHGVATIPDCL